MGTPTASRTTRWTAVTNMSEWRSEAVVKEYADKTSNPVTGWYEYLVNFPDLARLIPDEAESVLDYGCGVGDFTQKLAQKFTTVVGADIEPILSIARSAHSELPFIEWDGSAALLSDIGTYDVIFSKLVIQFIPDLDALAANFRKILNKDGLVVLSVPNPPRIAEKFHLVPDSIASYDDEVGTTGIKIHPIYRSKQNYIDVFTRAGFALVEVSEPETPRTLAEQHNYPVDADKGSRRLNIKLQAV